MTAWIIAPHQFPRYPVADLPEMPEGFVDTSWANNSAPSCDSEALCLSVWCDFADPDASEWPEERKSGALKRFSVHPTMPDGSFSDDFPALETDEWADVLAFINLKRQPPIVQLVAEFAAWRAANNAPEGDAFDLTFWPDLTQAQGEWLLDFISRWDEAEEADPQFHEKQPVVTK